MANRVEVTSAGYRKRKVRIVSEGERDLSAVIEADELTGQLTAADQADVALYGDRGEPVSEGPPADQAQTEPAPDPAQTEQPPAGESGAEPASS